MEDMPCTNKRSTLKSRLLKPCANFEVESLHLEEAKSKRQLTEDDKSNSSDGDLAHKLNITEYASQFSDENSRSFEKSRKKYKKGQLEEIVDELEELIPSVKPRMRTLIRDLDTGKAELVDDKSGRPFLKYND